MPQSFPLRPDRRRGALPELRNRTLPLDELWGAAAHTLRDELRNAGTPQAALQRLKAHLLRRLHHAPATDTMVLRAIGALQRDPASALIEPVQRASGCTPAHFIRRFERAVGLTPKRYARVLRFHTMLLVRAGRATGPSSPWRPATSTSRT